MIGLSAAAVGCTEELIFRGFLQQQLRKINVVLAVVVATASHTGYKIAFFAALSPVHAVNLKFLLVWTFIVGLIFGILKEYSGSTLTPVAGHASFDLLVYGDSSINPWWLWA
jgi:membrane protease YdiL (CAAX protease family)